MTKRPGGHNDAEDAMRHAEWNRRMADETNQFTAWAAGVQHEIEGLFNGQPWPEAMMDLHNNAEGRKSAKEGRTVDPSDLRTAPEQGSQYNPYGDEPFYDNPCP